MRISLYINLCSKVFSIIHNRADETPLSCSIVNLILSAPGGMAIYQIEYLFSHVCCSLEKRLKHSAIIFDSSLPFVMQISLSKGSWYSIACFMLDDSDARFLSIRAAVNLTLTLSGE